MTAMTDRQIWSLECVLQQDPLVDPDLFRFVSAAQRDL
jgi:hypothetical protein